MFTLSHSTYAEVNLIAKFAALKIQQLRLFIINIFSKFQQLSPFIAILLFFQMFKLNSKDYFFFFIIYINPKKLKSKPSSLFGLHLLNLNLSIYYKVHTVLVFRLVYNSLINQTSSLVTKKLRLLHGEKSESKGRIIFVFLY